MAKKIAGTYHEWKKIDDNYEDVKGFCKSATLEDIKKHKFVMTPGRYVGIPDEEEDFDFYERFTSLKAEFNKLLKEEEKLNKIIIKNLDKIKVDKNEI